MPERLSIAQVTPFAWEEPHEVNEAVRRVSDQLAARGHHVLIVAPSSSAELVREGRKAARAGSGTLPQRADGAPHVIAVGEATLPLGGRSRATLPLDVTRTLTDLFERTTFDLCHVHEPFGPSVASVALRHSRALNVGSFHAPSEPLVATQVARRVVELVFGRLDARTASYETTAAIMRRHFPASYEIVQPGSPSIARAKRPARGPVRIAFVEREERPALRLLLRALRHVTATTPWELVVLSARGPSSTPLRAELRDRVRYVSPDQHEEHELFSGADIFVAASPGLEPQPALIAQAHAAGAVPLVSGLPIYAEIIGEGERGLQFTPGDPLTLAGQLTRLIDDRGLRTRLTAAGAPRDWRAVTDEIEELYWRILARRKVDTTPAPLRKRLAKRPLIDVDLHMHTDHSHDCATPVEVLLATAAERGLGVIAITDHNEVSGALDAERKAADFGMRVIVAEEVKTASQGEVIGLFIREKIPRGLTLAETVADIKRQGGLVYVPHPFDRMHAVPDYEHLLDIIDDIDLIEVFNPRVAIGSFNEEAARFAEKYRIPAGVGSDSHVAQGLGSARVRMRDFDDPEEFLASIRDAELITSSGTLVYVQALKFLQTTATPKVARQAMRDRRVKRASRKG